MGLRLQEGLRGRQLGMHTVGCARVDAKHTH